MKERFLSVVLCLCMCLALCSCDDKSNVPAVVVDGNAEMEEEICTENELAWCPALFENPATHYNNKLALVAAEMSEAAEDTTGNGIEAKFDQYNINSHKPYKYTSGTVLPVIDIELAFEGGAFAIGDDTLNIDGIDTTILVITARGSKTLGEFAGDLWKGWYLDPNKVHALLNKTVWDNIYDFEEQLWEGINDYIKDHPTVQSAKKLKILITGHSLGGAAANLLGAEFTNGVGGSEWWGDKVTKDDIYVYTFGAIKVLTTEENASVGYENIHNIYNHYDSFGPNGNLGFTGASSVNAKFGHTEEYQNDHTQDPSNDGSLTVNHNMSSYVSDLRDGLISSAPCESCEGTNSCLRPTVNGGSGIQTASPELTAPSEPGNQYDGFSIKGTWKNVGTSTFGQAQLGSIIVFDGTHCNYYSPYDTYVMNYENGQWVLDCVSYIFAETLRFRVDIVDENTIDIYYGSDAVRLTRIAQNAEMMQEPEPPQQAESDFAIEGSWLSVGSNGFGQAQPGMTVTFDGTHCNFFSPYDTYAFYQDNGQWKLDCTSFLFSETLTFRVEIVDGESINVYYGSNCTELRRTG